MHEIIYGCGHLKRHKLKHTGERNFSCVHCDKSFYRLDSLQKHAKVHAYHQTGVKNFTCDHCNKSFYRLDGLQKHIKVHIKKSEDLVGNCSINLLKTQNSNTCDTSEISEEGLNWRQILFPGDLSLYVPNYS